MWLMPAQAKSISSGGAPMYPAICRTVCCTLWQSPITGTEVERYTAQQIMLTEVKFDPSPSGGAKVSLTGLAKDFDAIRVMKDSLQNDPSRRVVDIGSWDDETTKNYSRLFKLLVFVTEEER